MRHSVSLPCVERKFLRDFFANIFEDIPEASPVLIHSNLAGIGYIDVVSSGDTLCRKYEEIISERAGGRTLLFPTFNYDCLKNGTFDLQKDFGQVGLLSSYFSRTYPHERTLTPTYNFCIRNNHQRFDLSPSIHPFGSGSTMERLVKLNGYILVFGISNPTKVLTIGHYIETLARVGYRCDKEFSIQIRQPSVPPIHHKMTIHVRPPVESIEYRIEKGVFPLGKYYDCKGSTAWLVNVKAYVEFRLNQLKDEEFSWLTQEKKVQVSELYKRFGRPLRLDYFEKVGDIL